MATRKTTKLDITSDGLATRPLLDDNEADDLTVLYKILANPHRLRLLHAIERAGEIRVGDLADQIGMSVQAVSNQLQRLADQRILEARRDGNSSYYRIIDPCVPGMIELGICLVEENAKRAAASRKKS